MSARALQLREGIAPTRDRLTTTVFMAALVHGVIIVGVTFGSAGAAARRRARPRSAHRLGGRARGAQQRHRHLPRAAHPARLGQQPRPGRGAQPARRGRTRRATTAAPTAPALADDAGALLATADSRVLTTSAPMPEILYFAPPASLTETHRGTGAGRGQQRSRQARPRRRRRAEAPRPAARRVVGDARHPRGAGGALPGRLADQDRAPGHA